MSDWRSSTTGRHADWFMDGNGTLDPTTPEGGGFAISGPDEGMGVAGAFTILIIVGRVLVLVGTTTGFDSGPGTGPARSGTTPWILLSIKAVDHVLVDPDPTKG